MNKPATTVRIVAAAASVLISAVLLGSVVLGMTSTDYADLSMAAERSVASDAISANLLNGG